MVPLLPYPAETAEILRTRQERAFALEDLLDQSSVRRADRCNRHDPTNLVEITGFTECGQSVEYRGFWVRLKSFFRQTRPATVQSRA